MLRFAQRKLTSRISTEIIKRDIEKKLAKTSRTHLPEYPRTF